jgi:Spy/CpxP family protein refolding chaperone
LKELIFEMHTLLLQQVEQEGEGHCHEIEVQEIELKGEIVSYDETLQHSEEERGEVHQREGQLKENQYDVASERNSVTDVERSQEEEDDGLQNIGVECEELEYEADETDAKVRQQTGELETPQGKQQVNEGDVEALELQQHEVNLQLGAVNIKFPNNELGTLKD